MVALIAGGPGRETPEWMTFQLCAIDSYLITAAELLYLETGLLPHGYKGNKGMTVKPVMEGPIKRPN